MSVDAVTTVVCVVADCAADVYRARIVAVGERGITTVLLGAVEFLLASPPSGNVDPRYRVLVSPVDGSWEVGVRMERTRRAARRALAEVQEILRRSSVEDARREFDLEA